MEPWIEQAATILTDGGKMITVPVEHVEPLRFDFEVETMRGLAKLRARQELEVLYREFEESVTDSCERERTIPLIRECVRYQD